MAQDSAAALRERGKRGRIEMEKKYWRIMYRDKHTTRAKKMYGTREEVIAYCKKMEKFTKLGFWFREWETA